MADKDKLDDIVLRNGIREAYGYSEEQLLKEMEEAEQSLDDSEFVGASERMFKRIMEMEAAESEAAKGAADEGTGSDVRSEAKVVRFGKKKIAATIVLVAVMVGALGVTAIGEKSYFFRRVQEPTYDMVLDNDSNKVDVSNLEQAYKEIDKLDIPVLKLGYLPNGFKFESIEISGNSAVIVFSYKENKIHFFQEMKINSTSRNIHSDKEEQKIVFNEWLNRDIVMKYNVLENQRIECGTEIEIGKNIYRLSGIIDKDEFEKIVKKLNFYD